MSSPHIFELVISLLGGAGTAISPFVLIWLTKGQRDIHGKIDEVFKEVEKSQRNDLKIIKARLRSETERILQKGEISYMELDSLEDLYEIYAEMGGNGVVQQNMTKIRVLPMKGEK